MLKIYADPITGNCRKVLAGLDLMAVPFELVHIDYLAGGHKTAEFLAINPNAALRQQLTATSLCRSQTRFCSTLPISGAQLSIIPRTLSSAPTLIAGCYGKPRRGSRAATSTL